MEEPIDITGLAKSFIINVSNNVSEKDGLYTFAFPSPKVDMTWADFPDQEKMFDDLVKRKSVMRMSQRGRFWFDKRFEAEVRLDKFNIGEDGTVRAVYEGMNLVDLTKYSYFARFLRWILRRDRE